MLLLHFEWASWLCASYPSDTVYPKTQNASAPKAHASRLPIENASYQLTLQGLCVITHTLKCILHPPPHTQPNPPSRLRICLVGCHGILLGCLECTLLSRLPFIPDTISDGRVCGPVEGGWPRHPRLFQPRPVARVHGVRALHVPVVVPIGVGVSAVFDLDGGPGLPPEMLRRLQSRLSFPGNRERQGQTLLRARWRFHHSAKKKK